MIILANGKNLYPEEIESHYRKSPFLQEIAVTTVETDDKPAGERLYAVLVANMDILRERKIVNAGDMLRYEMERLGASLPSYKRVLGYEIWFEPLPRTTTGKLKRHEIVRRLKLTPSADAPQVEASAEDAAWLDDPHVSAALTAVKRRATEGVSCLPNANLELDLGPGLDGARRAAHRARTAVRGGRPGREGPRDLHLAAAGRGRPSGRHRRERRRRTRAPGCDRRVVVAHPARPAADDRPGAERVARAADVPRADPLRVHARGAAG